MKITALVKLFAIPFSQFAAIFALFTIYYLLFTIPPAFASPAPNTNPDGGYQTAPPDVPNNLHNFTQNVTIEIMSAITCQLTGIDPVNPKQACLGVDQESGKIGFVQGNGGGGAIGVVGNMITMLYTPPLHTKDYFQNLAANFGLAKKAYAQTTGFTSLKPLMGLWTAFRNIVYLIFVLVFILIGLLVMLRVKIDPRTVMTIQNQIPKLIIGIVLVTFSFAIAGFLIDVMWVFIYLVYAVISGAQVPGVDVSNLNPAFMQGKTALDAVGGLGSVAGIANTAAGSVTKIVGDFLGINQKPTAIFDPINFITQPLFTKYTVIDWIIDALSAIAANQAITRAGTALNFTTPILGDVGNLFKGATAVGAGYAAFTATEGALRVGLPWLITWLIIILAVLFALFRLWFTLLVAYVFILVDIVLAPFWILAGLFPGSSSISFTGWLRDLGANLIAFPATIAMFLMAKVFMDAFSSTQTGNQFVPPLIGNPGAQEAISSLIGLGFILLTPDVVRAMKAWFRAPKIDLSAINRALGVGAGTITAPAQMITQGLTFLGGQKIATKIPIIGPLVRQGGKERKEIEHWPSEPGA